jgi:hypothetical protein
MNSRGRAALREAHGLKRERTGPCKGLTPLFDPFRAQQTRFWSGGFAQSRSPPAIKLSPFGTGNLASEALSRWFVTQIHS